MGVDLRGLVSRSFRNPKEATDKSQERWPIAWLCTASRVASHLWALAPLVTQRAVLSRWRRVCAFRPCMEASGVASAAPGGSQLRRAANQTEDREPLRRGLTAGVLGPSRCTLKRTFLTCTIYMSVHHVCMECLRSRRAHELSAQPDHRLTFAVVRPERLKHVQSPPPVYPCIALSAGHNVL